MNIYKRLKECFYEIVDEYSLEDEEVTIHIRTLSPEESIGITERKDFPILTGEEKMIEATFRSSKGQAFTSAQVNYRGKIGEILKLDIEGDYHNRGVFIAVLNAVMKEFNLVEKTIHCKGAETEKCSLEIRDWYLENYKGKNIALIGYQPAMLESLSLAGANIKVLDLNPKNIGETRYGVLVGHGKDDYVEVVEEWADVVLCTGSSIINGSISMYLNLSKPVYFYGNTIAGPARCLNLNRLCFYAE